MVSWESLFFIALIFIAWIGGSHSGMKQSRILSEAYQTAVTHNSKLRELREQRDLEFMKLQNRVYQLENELENYKIKYTAEINDLSSKVVWLREQLGSKDIVS